MDRLWMRTGDVSGYERFDSPYDAGYDVSVFFEGVSKMPKIARYGRYGITIEPIFVGYNYISLFWGDADAQPTKGITNADLAEFKRGLAEGADIKQPVRKKRAKSKTKTKSPKLDVGTQLRLMR